MRKLPKNHYLIELFTKSLQGKSWLDVGSNQSDLSKALGRALSTRDFKVASHSPREPHMLKFRGSDLSEVPDKSYDYVLFNWSIGKFTTQSILNEAKRIAREGIIVQDFLAAGDRMPAGLTTPNYQLYEEQQWREILSSYGRVIVTQQLPEQALDLGMRIPMQVRLFVVQVDDVRDTMPAAPDPDDFAMHIANGMPPNSSTIAFSSAVLEPTPKITLGIKLHQDMADLLNSHRPGEAVATFRPPEDEGPFPHTQEDLLAAADARNFRDITPEELDTDETIVDGDYQGLETNAFLDSSSSPSKEE